MYKAFRLGAKISHHYKSSGTLNTFEIHLCASRCLVTLLLFVLIIRRLLPPGLIKSNNPKQRMCSLRLPKPLLTMSNYPSTNLIGRLLTLAPPLYKQTLTESGESLIPSSVKGLRYGFDANVMKTKP